MRILIDTQILIWHLEGDSRVSSTHRQMIADASNTVFVSAASLWEIAIKVSLGKLVLTMGLEEILQTIHNSTSEVLDVGATHAIKVASLPFMHNDPFDRLIISQAIVEGLPIMSTDRLFGQYGVQLL